MPVRLTNSQRGVKLPVRSLRRAAEKALGLLGCRDAELSVLITGDRKMRALNRLYRGMDRTTDVLSFSMSEGGVRPSPDDAAENGPPVLLGDVVVSAPMALAQAEGLGHGVGLEVWQLILHGILHLLGYDHESGAADRRRMEEKQRELAGLLDAE